MTEDIFYSVVIPSGREKVVANCLEALRAQTVAERIEVLLVTPCPEAFGAFSEDVKVVGVPDLYPPGRMRNLGAEASRGRVLLFIDDDCVPPKEWVEVLAHELDDNPEVGMVGCRVENHHDGFLGRCADYCLFSAFQYRDRADRNLGSAAIGVRREAFLAAKGFDEELRGSEDWDFSLRLRECGK